eukprot:607349-Hanusia_phi.AAC.4
MKREYTRSDFEMLVDYLLQNVPGITIATDIICGFPTESEEDFLQTMELLDKYKFPVVNIAQFYPRPGTVAAKMPKLQSGIVKDRSRRVTAHFESYRTWDHLVGRRERVWVIEYGKDENYVVGHTEGYTQVLLPRDAKLLGRSVIAQVVSADKWSVKGEVVEVLEEEGLPQVSIARKNILPSPSELKSQKLHVAGRNKTTSLIDQTPAGAGDRSVQEHTAKTAPEVVPKTELRNRFVAWLLFASVVLLLLCAFDPLMTSCATVGCVLLKAQQVKLQRAKLIGMKMIKEYEAERLGTMLSDSQIKRSCSTCRCDTLETQAAHH